MASPSNRNPSQMMSYLRRNWRAICICLFVSIASFQFGYDGSYFGGILAMEPFDKLYGHYDASKAAYVLSSRVESIVTSIINVGEFVGAVSSFVLGDHLGRRRSLLVALSAVVVGVILQTASTGIGLLIAGRLVLGYAVGLISCVVPLYVADCAPARVRGALVSMYQFCIALGLLLGTIVDYATHTRTDSGSFRIPMAIQLVFPLILVPGLLLFVPESPRWLLEHGKTDQARASLIRLKGDELELIEHEIISISRSAEDRSARGSWASVFKWGPEGRKAYLGFALQALQQASGINFVTSYGVVFFANVGIDNPFLVNVGLWLVCLPAICISQFAMERFGRRAVLITAGILNTVVLIIMGGCGLASDKSLATEKAIVAMVYIFLVVFNLGWGPVVWVVTSEISTGSNRNKLMSLSTGSNWFFNWLVSFTFPYLFNPDGANLGARIGFLYGSLILAATVWIYFLLPETSGRSLEDIDTMFQNHVPTRKFRSYKIVPNTPVEERSMKKVIMVSEDEKIEKV